MDVPHPLTPQRHVGAAGRPLGHDSQQLPRLGARVHPRNDVELVAQVPPEAPAKDLPKRAKPLAQESGLAPFAAAAAATTTTNTAAAAATVGGGSPLARVQIHPLHPPQAAADAATQAIQATPTATTAKGDPRQSPLRGDDGCALHRRRGQVQPPGVGLAAHLSSGGGEAAGVQVVGNKSTEEGVEAGLRGGLGGLAERGGMQRSGQPRRSHRCRTTTTSPAGGGRWGAWGGWRESGRVRPLHGWWPRGRQGSLAPRWCSKEGGEGGDRVPAKLGRWAQAAAKPGNGSSRRDGSGRRRGRGEAGPHRPPQAPAVGVGKIPRAARRHGTRGLGGGRWRPAAAARQPLPPTSASRS